MSAQRGDVSAQRGDVSAYEGYTPNPQAQRQTPPCGHGDTCENITFPQLLLWTVNIQAFLLPQGALYGNQWMLINA